MGPGRTVTIKSACAPKFAVKAGVHRTYMSSIELGKVGISVGIAVQVAQALGIPLSVLIRDAEKPPP